MSKLQGLDFLAKQFAFQADQMISVLLYKNLLPEKRLNYALGLGEWVIHAKTCQDIAWNLIQIQAICEQGSTEPEDYDPFYDAENDVQLDPAQHAPIPYDPYREMAVYMHDANAPHGLHNQLGSDTIEAAEILLQGPRTLLHFENELGERLMQRDCDDPEGPFRPMTDQERRRHARQQETTFIEETVFLLDFNAQMEILSDLILGHAPFAEIIELIGPASTLDDEAEGF